MSSTKTVGTVDSTVSASPWSAQKDGLETFMAYQNNPALGEVLTAEALRCGFNVDDFRQEGLEFFGKILCSIALGLLVFVAAEESAGRSAITTRTFSILGKSSDGTDSHRRHQQRGLD